MTDFDNARKLARSPEGRQLASLLQQLGGPALQEAVDKAAKGDFSQAQLAIAALMRDPKARQLLEQLGGSNGK